MSKANRVALAVIEESTYGTKPAGNMEELRFTSEDFAEEPDTTISNEIRADRQVTDVVRTDINAPGSFNFEMSHGVTGFEQLLAGLLGDTSTGFAAVPSNTTGTISISTGTPDQITSDGVSPDFTAESISVGDWILLSAGFDTEDGEFVRVTNVTASALDVEGADLSAVTGGGDEVIRKAAVLENGTAKKSFTVQKQFQDLTTSALDAVGFRVGSLSLNVAPGAIITGSLGGQAKRVNKEASSLATLNGAATNDVMNGVDGVDAIKVKRSGLITGIEATELTVQMQNNLRRQPAIGVLGTTDIGIGRFTASGTLNVYFADFSLYDEFHAFNEIDIAFPADDGNDNFYLIDIPAIKLTGGRIVTPGIDEDVVAAFNWQAKRFLDSGNSLDYMVRILKF